MDENRLEPLIPDIDTVTIGSFEYGVSPEDIKLQTENLRKAVNMLIEADRHMCEICTGTFPNSKECNPKNCYIGKKIKFIEDLTGKEYSDITEEQ